jgi:hypothetical protein
MDAYKGFVEFTELTSIGITREETGRIKNGRGAYIHVKKGTVWITHDGCDKDVVLGPGASYYIKRDGLTLISPLQGPFALVTIESTISVDLRRSEQFWKFWAVLYAAMKRIGAGLAPIVS